MAVRITHFGMVLAAGLALLPTTGLRAAEALAPAAPRVSTAQIVLEALSLVGVPYRYGSDDPARGLDCSGLVRHAFRLAGLELPRSAEGIARLGVEVAADAVEVGDLVFFNTRGRRFSHVGIYVGEGRFVHAPARRGHVRVEDMALGYWRARFNGARRLPVGDAALTARSAAAAPGPAPPECASCER